MPGIQTRVFRQLLRLAAKRSIEVIVDAPFLTTISGLWGVDGDSEYICLNKKLRKDPAKMNHVFAHELGHSILHKGRLESARYQENHYSNAYKSAIEVEADRFAEKLLRRLEEKL